MRDISEFTFYFSYYEFDFYITEKIILFFSLSLIFITIFDVALDLRLRRKLWKDPQKLFFSLYCGEISRSYNFDISSYSLKTKNQRFLWSRANRVIRELSAHTHKSRWSDVELSYLLYLFRSYLLKSSEVYFLLSNLFTFFLSYLHFIIHQPSSFSCKYMPNSFFNTFPLFFYAIADRQMTTRPVGQIFMIAWARVKAEIEAVKPQLISSDEIIIIRMKFVVDREIVI